MADRRFSGDASTRWLTENVPDRDMRLLADFWFEDSKGVRWDAPVGSEINGASIPRPLWSLVGSPYTGDYRRASIVHDIACDRAAGDRAARRAADKMFFEACRAGGCTRWQATVLYIGVRIGAGWRKFDELQNDEPRLAFDDVDRQVQHDLRTVSDQVLSRGESDDPDEVEARVDEAFALLALRRAALAEVHSTVL
jgi:hypothetical protein